MRPKDWRHAVVLSPYTGAVTTRQALHLLIDSLPDELLTPVEHALQQLTPIDDSALDAVLDAAPLEDEALTPREMEALKLLESLRERRAS